ncbi:MAG: hypothetical protein ACT4OY_01665 [Alphaproteobacteria bacterium]
MNFRTILLFLFVIFLLGGLAALTFMDVPVEQKEISKEIPYDSATP